MKNWRFRLDSRDWIGVFDEGSAFFINKWRFSLNSRDWNEVLVK